MGYTNLEASKALKAAGFDQRPSSDSMFWALHYPESTYRLSPGQIISWSDPRWKFITAPDALTALDWLETEHGWYWERYYPHEIGTPPEWSAHDRPGEGFSCGDPDQLIITVCAYIIAHVAAQPAPPAPEGVSS